eukprot:g231.t1
MKTFEVCDRIIKNVTLSAKSSYATYLANRLLERKTSGSDTEATFEMCESANCFVSHAWAYPFDILLETMKDDAAHRAAEGKQTYYWLDIVAINQHKTQSLSDDFWSNAFRRSIGKIGRTLVVIYPWKNPICTKRCWCLWEIYASVCTNSILCFKIAPQEIESFRSSLTHHFEDLMRLIGTVDVAKADASVESDKKRIFAAIRNEKSGVSLDALNTMIMMHLHQWLKDSAIDILSEVWPESLESDATRDERLSPPIMGRRRRWRMSKDPERTMKLAHQVARLLLELTEYDAGIRLLRKSAKKAASTLGLAHATTQKISNLLLWVLIDRGRYEEAKHIVDRAIASNIQTFGARSPITLQNWCHQLRILHETARMDEALEVGKKAIVFSEAADVDATGESDRPTERTLELYFLVGKLLCDMHMYDQSAELLKRAIKGADAMCVPRHWIRMSSEAFLGKVRLETGAISDARDLLTHALRDARVARGETHKITLYAKAFYCRALVLSKKPTERSSSVVSTATRTLADCKKVLGPKHWLTLYATENMKLLRGA